MEPEVCKLLQSTQKTSQFAIECITAISACTNNCCALAQPSPPRFVRVLHILCGRFAYAVQAKLNVNFPEMSGHCSENYRTPELLFSLATAVFSQECRRRASLQHVCRHIGSSGVLIGVTDTLTWTRMITGGKKNTLR